MRSTSRAVRLTGGALALAGLVGLAACGSDDDSAADTSTTDTTAAPDTTAAADTTTTAEDPAAEAASTVATADTDLGTILVDGERRTLYLFMPDAQGASTCVDSCAATWPALPGPAAGDGVDEALLGTADRPDDGSAQATFNSWPLYYFASDAAPGDTNGQGVGDVWYVVDAEGNPVTG